MAECHFQLKSGVMNEDGFERRDGWRYVIALLRPDCFGAPCTKVHSVAFEYKDANLCLDPPAQQVKVRVIADVLLPVRKVEPWRPLTQQEATWTKLWPEGRSAIDCDRYNRGMEGCSTVGPEGIAYRLCWTTPCYDQMYDSLVCCLHPSEDRLLSGCEMRDITGHLKIEAWAQAQAQACIEDEWGDQDWESSYQAETEEWTGGDVPGKAVKIFDLRDWRGYYFNKDDYDAKIPKRRRHVGGRRRELPSDGDRGHEPAREDL